MKKTALFFMSCALAAGLPFYAHAQQQGVSKTEIVLGTITDLSGPLTLLGKQARFGMQMKVDEINEKGGILGRKIKLIVEDNAYDPKRSVLAMEKLVNQDQVFMVVGHLGTSHNMATMPILFEKSLVNFLPMAPAREMYEAPNQLKYAYSVTVSDQARVATPKLFKEKNLKRACVLYQDDEFGLEILRGGEAGLKTINSSFVEKTSYKRGATDFSSQIAKLKSANCDMIVLGTVIRETIAALGEARKIGFSPLFLANSGVYTDAVHKLGGAAVEGLYATMTANFPYPDEKSEPLRSWIQRYQAKFKEDPTTFSIFGHMIIDQFAAAAEKAGTNLTTDTFVAAMNTMSFPMDMFGNAPATFTATKRLGNDLSRIAQIQDGRWKIISDYAK